MKSKYDELLINLCYDRFFCRSIGVDYNRMNQEDINKIKKHMDENIFRGLREDEKHTKDGTRGGLDDDKIK